MKRRFFGTDGVRGLANVYPMTVETALSIGRAVAYFFRESRNRKHRILIGKDTRRSCYMLENALVAGICSMGANAYVVGPMPTPAIAFLATSMRADAGVVISASHNKFEDNGIKLFAGDGFKLPDHAEIRIEELMEQDLSHVMPTGANVGRARRIEDAQGRYIVFVKHTFPKDLTLDGLKIVLDCANGAAYKVAPAVFEELGADLIKVGIEPNGININKDCGAMHPERLSQLVKQHGADIGLALDGDGDRLIVTDEKGNIVNGDHIMAICAKHMIENKTLNYNTVVATVMSNMGLEKALEAMGGRLVRTNVGDRYVVETMREKGYNFGGEQSGHLIFLDHITTGDGILAALQLLAVMQRSRRPLSELASIMEDFPQVLHNVTLQEKKTPAEIPGLNELQGKLERGLKGSGRILIRPSGTEPVLRIMVEGEDHDRIEEIAHTLAEHVENNA